MLEDQVAYLLQRYLGNYVRGLNKEALKISVWRGDVELTNMQLKPEALNALKLPVKVKAGFLGSVKLKVPWSRLGQDPVVVHLDRIFLLAEPATQVEGSTEDAIQEAKKSRVREMEMKLLEKTQQLKSEVNKSWLGSLVSTIVGNLKLSISNIHIRYEDVESNPGHPFAAGVTLEKLLAVTVDDNGKETFVTDGALDRIQKSVELDRLALYLDSNIVPWHIDKPWEDLFPSEWVQVFRYGTKDGKPADRIIKKHTYILEPVTGNAKYTKLRTSEFAVGGQPLQKAAVNLDDVTLCLSKDGYRDMLKLADNFSAFNQRLKYAHFRPHVPVKSDPRSWWKYAYRAVSDQVKKGSGKLPWEQVLRYARLRKRYISLYASLLKSEPSRVIVDDNEETEELDRELDIEVILQWRMLAHRFVEKSLESELRLRKEKSQKSWWSFAWNNKSSKDETEPFHFSEEDWEQLNRIIGYKEGDDNQLVLLNDKADTLHTSLNIYTKHSATKLIDGPSEYVAELSCEGLDCFIRFYPETKVFDVKLGSYRLSSPHGLLAESATTSDSLRGVFCYKPFDVNVDWSMVAKASPCYVTYLKVTIDQIIKFFQSSSAVSQTLALEAAAAVQMTIDGVRRTAQEQVNKALKNQSRFLLDIDIAAPKITIPTDFCPDDLHSTKLMLDLGNLVIRTEDEFGSSKELDMYLQFNLVLRDVSAFLVDGDYHWGQVGQVPANKSSSSSANLNHVSFLPVIDNCGAILKLQQIRLENPSYPSTRLAIRLPSLGFHFSPARYHRLMQIAKLFQGEDMENSDFLQPWNQADFEGWLSVLTRKGVGNREAVWQRRYLCLVGPFLYVLESPRSKSYKQYIRF
ncbi:Vacuolar protein sorting-associated protein [Trema orientale]|uniref:Vacuolar protein sorting-associated protein n=1 Tax=Trema orientale TaxID=63057 RepID=A0A2P5FZ92_TREOI|nr:Vacuolar protein sorting-associated protein [Trema orientale]